MGRMHTRTHKLTHARTQGFLGSMAISVRLITLIFSPCWVDSEQQSGSSREKYWYLKFGGVPYILKPGGLDPLRGRERISMRRQMVVEEKLFYILDWELVLHEFVQVIKSIWESPHVCLDKRQQKNTYI